MNASYKKSIEKAANLYEMAEHLSSVRWDNEEAEALHREYFNKALDEMTRIASDHGKTYREVLADVRAMYRAW